MCLISDGDSIVWFLAGAGTALGLFGLIGMHVEMLTDEESHGERAGMITEFVRDEEGRIVEVVERPLG